MDWKGLVVSSGWEFLSKCNCGGVPKERWKKKEYEVKVVNGSVFYLYHKGKQTNKGAIFNLEQTIKDI